MTRLVAPALCLAIAACGRGPGEPAAAPSASRLELDLVIVNAEASKDSHEQTESFRLTRGQLRWSRTYSGYGAERSPPTSGTVTVGEAALVRLIELCRTRHLDQGAREEGATLHGPGNLFTYLSLIHI